MKIKQDAKLDNITFEVEALLTDFFLYKCNGARESFHVSHTHLHPHQIEVTTQPLVHCRNDMPGATVSNLGYN